jgi:hypothetical protein
VCGLRWGRVIGRGPVGRAEGGAIGGRCRISGGFMRGRSFEAGAALFISFFFIMFLSSYFYFTAI